MVVKLEEESWSERGDGIVFKGPTIIHPNKVSCKIGLLTPNSISLFKMILLNNLMPTNIATEAEMLKAGSANLTHDSNSVSQY